MALHAYAARPSRSRLAIFFALYALAFGNHLSMILLFVPFTIFILQVTRERRVLFAPATIAMAIVIAAVGALQYWPNLISSSHLLDGPATWTDRFAAFWFDTTKADWRDSMVMGVRSDQLAGRFGMWWFDARQQFGAIGLFLAAIGVVRLWMISRPWATLVVLGYAINTVFAFTYNVGDTHVFYLPGHLFTAFLAGVAISSIWRVQKDPPYDYRGSRRLLVLLYAGWRAWDTWPAIDRHNDRRAEALVTRLDPRCEPADGMLGHRLELAARERAPLLQPLAAPRHSVGPALRTSSCISRFSFATTRRSRATSSWIPIRPGTSWPPSGPSFRFSRIRYEHRPIFSMRSRAWHAARHTSCAC